MRDAARTGPPPAGDDADSRVLAQTCFDRPLVLEAGAGTGKTTALVARIVAWALGEGWQRAAARLGITEPAEKRDEDRIAARALQRIVAITFTDAAAAEMATRVGATLSGIAHGESPDALVQKFGLHLPALPSDAGVRSRRAKSLVGALDRLGVRTIHAFARRLLAAHPVEAGLHPAFEVDADGSAAAQIVRELLELRLREAYADPGDPVLLGLAARGVSASHLEEALLQLLQSATPPALLEEDPFDLPRLDALRRTLATELEQLCSLAGAGIVGNGKTKAAADLILRAGEVCNRLRAPMAAGLEGLAALCEVVRERLEPRLGRLAEWGKGKFNPSEEKAIGAEAAATIHALAPSLHDRLQHLCGLDALRLDLARRALAPLLATATEALRVRGLVSYDGLLQGAARLLGQDVAVAARERGQIDQLLVDEFQDTDALQCTMVGALTLEGEPADRPGLFLVGDPKQSIYGWRGADLGAYDAFVERVLEAGGQRCLLSMNHRSVQPILDEVERVMRPAMREERGLQPRFEPLLATRGREAQSGSLQCGKAAVEYWISRVLVDGHAAVATRKPEATALEARALARDVSRLVHEQGVAPRDVGVLLRGFGDVEEYLSALRDAGIPYAVARDRSYYRRREIVDACCLVRCVVDPSDTLALVALLRSSAVGVPDAALLPLWQQRIPSLVARLPENEDQTLAKIHEAVSQAAASVPAEVPGIERAQGWEHALLFALEVLGALRRSFAADPSDVFVERLRTFLLFEAGEAARPLGAFRLANLERFFRQLAAALAEGADPAAVLRHLRQSAREQRDAEEARPLEAAEQAVQVMSIHKAKGLGFAHTYVLQLHKAPGHGGREGPPARAVLLDGRAELRLLGERTPGFLQVEARVALTEAAEQVRTLYVAMTRAKDRLVLAGLWPEAQSKAKLDASYVPLLRAREAGVPPLDEILETLRSEARTDRVESHEASWVFPALQETGAASADAEGHERETAGPSAAARAARAGADARNVAEARAWARTRMARRFGGPVTQLSHEWAEDVVAARREAEPVDPIRAATAPGGARDLLASAVGTAVHHALEHLDLSLEAEDALVALRTLVARALAAADLDAAAVSHATARADLVLGRFVRSGLFPRLRELAPHVVARELPVLLPPAPSEDGPVGYVGGKIDLVYLDPGTGEPVVADYKTGAAEGDDEIGSELRRHALQGVQYVRAVREAFGLQRDPRFELWFLHAGRIEPAP